MRKDYDDGEDILGVGRLEPKVVTKPTRKGKTFSVAAAPKRASKVVSKWSPIDVGGEFSSRVSRVYPNYLGQANAVVCAKVFGNLMKSKGITSTEMVCAMDIFFADERNFSDIGSGVPIWLKFLRSFPYIQEQARRMAGEGNIDWENEANNV